MPYGIQWTAQALPGWLAQQYERIAQEAEKTANPTTADRAAMAAAGMPYNPNPEKLKLRLAGFNPQMRRSFQLGENVGLYQPHFNSAQQNLAAASQRFPTQYQAYMNPYQQAVVENIARLGNRNFEENIMPRLASQFVGLGQHGSTRHQQMAERAARDLQQEILAQQRNAMHQGYESAGKLFNADALRQAEVGNQQAQLGRYAQAAHLGDIAQLQEIGQQRMDQRQKELDLERQNYERKEMGGYKMQQLGAQNAILHHLPHQQMTTGQNVIHQPGTAQPDTLRRIGGLAASLYGATRGGQGFAKGGSIKKSKLPKLKVGLSGLKLNSTNFKRLSPHLPKLKGLK